ncbi:squalene cyclase [Paenibacillus doosanensis]|uniref:terpene cyclase/mutase family protein n=1 Tax=Paenibacillus doosanensis TaxID=1229154 RepID=UPI00217FDB9E|nr:prenyltransferase/squalene oxidase repeat-containing protein [Paenibacillus doosanensis]MCS7458808.1 squalene cyclase [Paenibacillus doosanensis]
MDERIIRSETAAMVNRLVQLQQADGSWRLCFETGTMTDAYLIILLRALRREDAEPLIRKLTERIAGAQEENGAWKLYYDEPEGNLDATAEAYYALLYSGYVSSESPRLKRARQFIVSRGGLSKVRAMLTQAMLAATGQSPWPDMLKVPVELLLAPPWFLFSIYDLSGHARVHLVPVMIMAGTGFGLRHEQSPDLSDLYVGGKQPFESHASWLPVLHKLLEAVPPLHFPIHQASLAAAERFMLDRIEPDGTLLTYSTATMLMIFSLICLGYDAKTSPVINKAIGGLFSLLCQDERKAHLQVSTSTVWDTAMLSCALQQAGVSAAHPVVRKAAEYLLPRQQTRYGDWALRAPHTPPGGWGFSDISTLYPDLDDTTAALRATRAYSGQGGDSLLQPKAEQAWHKGTRWVRSMQNDNGGWPSFEREPHPQLLQLFQFDSAEDIAVDASTTDLSGRTLQFWGDEAGLTHSEPFIRKAADWLLSQQRPDGSWFGRWGICYIHGSSAVATGLLAVGLPADHAAIRRAAGWVESVQNEDGGWGESCRSDKVKRYVPLGGSTPSQTAWALDLLIAVHDRPTPSIDRGVTRLIELLHRRDWRFSYPTGGGLPGSVYVNYHSNNYIWPLLTFSRYLRRYGGVAPE